MPKDSGNRDEVNAFYARGLERDRLAGGDGALEFPRTQVLLGRFLPPAPAEILDVCGGPPDASMDAVLLLGPLYHLQDRADRIKALAEAARVCRPGGVVIAAGISRFASALDGLRGGHLNDPTFAGIVDDDLRDGRHQNPTGNPFYFTTAYFHRPEDLAAEVAAAGLIHEATVAIEGPAWLLPDLDSWLNDERRRAVLLATLERLEREPALLGASAHLLTVARRAQN